MERVILFPFFLLFLCHQMQVSDLLLQFLFGPECSGGSLSIGDHIPRHSQGQGSSNWSPLTLLRLEIACLERKCF